MKHIILTLFAFACLLAAAQGQITVAKYATTTTLINDLDVAALSGADTTIYFQFPSAFEGHGFSVEITAADTVVGGAIGVYLKGSNKTYYGLLTDSLSIDVSTVEQTKFFTGQSFPYKFGAVYVKKNDCTEGILDIVIYTN